MICSSLFVLNIHLLFSWKSWRNLSMTAAPLWAWTRSTWRPCWGGPSPTWRWRCSTKQSEITKPLKGTILIAKSADKSTNFIVQRLICLNNFDLTFYISLNLINPCWGFKRNEETKFGIIFFFVLNYIFLWLF